MQRATLEVNDCVLRAPFDGEIAARSVDPGAFVRPGTRGRDAGRSHHRAGHRRGAGGRLRGRRRGHAGAGSRAGDEPRAAREDRAALAAGGPLHAHHPPRDRHPRSRVGRCPWERPPSWRIEVGRAGARDRDPARRGLGARQQGDGLRRRGPDGARKGVYAVKGERGGSLFLEPLLPAGESRRHRRAGAAPGRRPRRGQARAGGARPRTPPSSWPAASRDPPLAQEPDRDPDDLHRR